MNFYEQIQEDMNKAEKKPFKRSLLEQEESGFPAEENDCQGKEAIIKEGKAKQETGVI